MVTERGNKRLNSELRLFALFRLAPLLETTVMRLSETRLDHVLGPSDLRSWRTLVRVGVWVGRELLQVWPVRRYGVDVPAVNWARLAAEAAGCGRGVVRRLRVAGLVVGGRVAVGRLVGVALGCSRGHLHAGGCTPVGRGRVTARGDHGGTRRLTSRTEAQLA